MQHLENPFFGLEENETYAHGIWPNEQIDI